MELTVIWIDKRVTTWWPPTDLEVDETAWEDAQFGQRGLVVIETLSSL